MKILYKHIIIEKLFYITYIFYFLSLLFIGTFSTIDKNTFVNIIGISSITTNLSPILIIRKVIETQDTSLIYLPQALIGLINLLYWLAYSIIINDLYQILPYIS
jgi:hypothetical protein